MSTKHQNRLRNLITKAGGEIEGQFVLKPGVMILMKTEVTPQAQDLFEGMNIDQDRPPYEQAGEFASRITYMSFRDEPGKSSEQYNRKMIEEYGHMSVHSCHNVTFLIAGVSVETVLELVAHSEASVARLTSSRTKAMDKPLYRVVPNSDGLVPSAQKSRLTQMTKERDIHREMIEDNTDISEDPDVREILNRLQPGAKAGALTYTMRVKDFHKTFIGRLSHHGVEAEMREVCEMMCEQLHDLYPLIIKKPEDYYEMSNSAKYLMED